VARLRWSLGRFTHDPNPVWMRELRQSARLQRTPVILMTITVAVALLICSVGGIASVTAEPARVGVGIFHTFFSLSFALVTWLGPAVAASTIAGEKNGRTWEALALTSLSPSRIARGKFLAAYTYIAMYLVMLAPVGALPFLFGGITAGEVVLAFLCCFVFAALAVSFGLAISSKFQSSAAAIIVTLLVTLTTSFQIYGWLGVGLSWAAHEQWPAVPQGPPVWLPTAWTRAEFGLPYVTFLVAVPAVAVLLPVWLFYEITIANLASPSDDRSTRLRLWTIAAALLLSATAALVQRTTRSSDWSIVNASVMFVFFTFVIFLIAGDPVGPSRRVRVAWQRASRPAWLRALGPGITPAAMWVLLSILFAFGSVVAAALLTLKTSPDRAVAVVVSAHFAGFLVFLVGLTAFFRATAQGATVPRVLLLAALLTAIIGPWIVLAIAGFLSQGPEEMQQLAAPSPMYAFVLVEKLRLGLKNTPEFVLPGVLCSVGYALLGVLLVGAAGSRAKRRNEEEQARAQHLDALLEAEARAVQPSAAAPGTS
jgi:ABC-type transport system involved in multi-copper enzyme maturation permease subunit